MIPIELLAVIDIAEMATHISAEKARYLDTMIEDGVRASTTYLRGVATTFPDGKVTCTVEKGRAEDTIIEKGEAAPLASARQEYLEHLVNRFC